MHTDTTPKRKPAGREHYPAGNPKRFALLNENQTFFLLSLSRTSERMVKLKVKLVQAFHVGRRAADQYRTEYLLTYHGLRDEIHALAAESSNRCRVHANINKRVNFSAGIDAGQRRACPCLSKPC